MIIIFQTDPGDIAVKKSRHFHVEKKSDCCTKPYNAKLPHVSGKFLLLCLPLVAHSSTFLSFRICWIVFPILGILSTINLTFSSSKEKFIYLEISYLFNHNSYIHSDVEKYIVSDVMGVSASLYLQSGELTWLTGHHSFSFWKCKAPKCQSGC